MATLLLRSVNEAMLRQMAVEIREEIPEAGVRLFGSQARGDARHSSEVDLVLQPHDKVEERHPGSFWMARSYSQAMHHVARRELRAARLLAGG